MQRQRHASHTAATRAAVYTVTFPTIGACFMTTHLLAHVIITRPGTGPQHLPQSHSREKQGQAGAVDGMPCPSPTIMPQLTLTPDQPWTLLLWLELGHIRIPTCETTQIKASRRRGGEGGGGGRRWKARTHTHRPVRSPSPRPLPARRHPHPLLAALPCRAAR